MDEERINIESVRTTLKECLRPTEDVHYDQITRYELDGDKLTLYTESQTYVLTRFPHSRMSEHAWSLYSITERQSGATLDVERFRMEYHHLLFAVIADRTFRFTDLDREQFTGTIEVESDGGVRLALDAESQQRLSNKPRKRARLNDATKNYELSKELYPTTYADAIKWSQVTSFRVFRGEFVVMGRTVKDRVLELYTDQRVYRFIPR